MIDPEEIEINGDSGQATQLRIILYIFKSYIKMQYEPKH